MCPACGPGGMPPGPLLCPNGLSRKTPSISLRLSPCVHWSVTTPKRVPKNRCLMGQVPCQRRRRFASAATGWGRGAGVRRSTVENHPRSCCSELRQSAKCGRVFHELSRAEAAGGPQARPRYAAVTGELNQSTGTSRFSSSCQLRTTIRSAVAGVSSGVASSFIIKKRPSIGDTW